MPLQSQSMSSAAHGSCPTAAWGSAKLPVMMLRPRRNLRATVRRSKCGHTEAR
eukprot:CAMPEP_0176067580 /NCGR_PEP_ID=MMETSP0120_2-20121206/33733_1 /TAXON_ID=160619 /ORGANISM="Kryptoperidinium foliaceum, Strain CCMP 1326" /LENGTH=52 /DNA_ID=CAMNT_0017401199 /DNA_START=362 /DNA_END=517 /DNA_ORIENTATION=+